MTGWLPLVALIAFALVLLRLLGVRGPFLMLAAAAICFGSVGYALQGRPGLPGSPRSTSVERPVMPVAAMRHAFFGEFTPTEHWLILSEGYASRGDTENAVGVMQSAVREHPGDAQLWIGLGNALMDHAGVLTPASEFAYRKAAELAPGHPAPIYFFGLALARSGDPAGALALWQNILANAPAEASWRPIVEDSIAVLRGSAAPELR